MARADHPLSYRSERGLSTQGALWSLAFGMIGLIYGGFAVMKLMSPHSDGELVLKADTNIPAAACSSRMMQLGSEAYDPEHLSCVIPQNGTPIWAVHGRWVEAKDFVDRDAHWMGAGTLQRRADGTELCPELTGVETVVYARTVTISQAERAKIEALVDEQGRVTLEHLESQRVLLDQKTQDKRFTRSVTLPRGTIRILVQAADQDTSTGLLFSLRGAGKRPVALSGENGWCMFRLAAAMTMPTLLNEASRCHACLGGKDQETL